MDESDVRVITTPITRREISAMAEEQFWDIVKAVVDVRRRVMAIGGTMHSDEEAVLLDEGSRRQDLWGINLRPASPPSEWIEFDSMINIRPKDGNNSRGVEDPAIRQRIRDVVANLVTQ